MQFNRIFLVFFTLISAVSIHAIDPKKAVEKVRDFLDIAEFIVQSKRNLDVIKIELKKIPLFVKGCKRLRIQDERYPELRVGNRNILLKDAKGDFVPQLDESGKPLYDSSGQPVYKKLSVACNELKDALTGVHKILEYLNKTILGSGKNPNGLFVKLLTVLGLQSKIPQLTQLSELIDTLEYFIDRVDKVLSIKSKKATPAEETPSDSTSEEPTPTDEAPAPDSSSEEPAPTDSAPAPDDATGEPTSTDVATAPDGAAEPTSTDGAPAEPGAAETSAITPEVEAKIDAEAAQKEAGEAGKTDVSGQEQVTEKAGIAKTTEKPAQTGQATKKAPEIDTARASEQAQEVGKGVAVSPVSEKIAGIAPEEKTGSEQEVPEKAGSVADGSVDKMAGETSGADAQAKITKEQAEISDADTEKKLTEEKSEEAEVAKKEPTVVHGIAPEATVDVATLEKKNEGYAAEETAGPTESSEQES